jgi:hypothetical protein
MMMSVAGLVAHAHIPIVKAKGFPSVKRPHVFLVRACMFDAFDVIHSISIHKNYLDRSFSCNANGSQRIEDFALEVTSLNGNVRCVRLGTRTGRKVLVKRLQSTEGMNPVPIMVQHGNTCGYYSVFHTVMAPELIPFVRKRLIEILSDQNSDETRTRTASVIGCVFLQRFQDQSVRTRARETIMAKLIEAMKTLVSGGQPAQKMTLRKGL